VTPCASPANCPTLLIPLVQARRANGSPTCRLLVGTRPWSEFAPLFDLARQAGEVLDLDALPAQQRRFDLADYVAGLLELLPGYTRDGAGWAGGAHGGGARIAPVPLLGHGGGSP
jgi:hypothetical protein